MNDRDPVDGKYISSGLDEKDSSFNLGGLFKEEVKVSAIVEYEPDQKPLFL